MANRKLNEDFVRNYFEEAGCRLISKYTGSKDRLVYMCKCGKRNTTCWNNFSRGYRCVYCRLKEKFGDNVGKLQKARDARCKLFTISDVSRILGFEIGEFHSLVRNGFIPAPTNQNPFKGTRKYYKEEDFGRIQKAVNEFLSC